MNPYVFLIIKVLTLAYGGAITYVAAYGHADLWMVGAAALAPVAGYLGGIADSQPAPWTKKPS